MKEIQIRKNDAGQRLDRFVGKAVPLLPESLLQKYIRLKRIKRNGKGAKRDVRLVEGDVLQLYINDEFFEKPTEHNAWLKIATPRLDIVYEDENILLADKKPGVLCHSAGEWSWDTLISNIQAYLRQTGQWDPKAENAFTPALCNRIDRNTGGIVIALIYLFSAFGIGAAIPTHEISEDSGLIDAVSLMTGRTSGLFVGAVALLFLITLFGNMISWSMGVNSTAAYAAENGDMPAIFARRWAKNDMPIGSALTSGIVASVVCILGIIIELLSPDSSLFWSFFALNLVMLLLSYAPVFPAFLRLREIDPDSERPFRVPGGRGMLRVLAYVPMALILISIFFTAVPLSFDSETLSGYLPITVGSILSIVIGEILIAARARRHHS